MNGTKTELEADQAEAPSQPVDRFVCRQFTGGLAELERFLNQEQNSMRVLQMAIDRLGSPSVVLERLL